MAFICQKNSHHHDHNCDRNSDCPVPFLSGLSLPNIHRVHAHIARHEVQRQKYRGHKREDKDGFALTQLKDLYPFFCPEIEVGRVIQDRVEFILVPFRGSDCGVED